MIDADELRKGMGFVSPYLQLYDEFTPLETLSLISRIRSGSEANQAGVKSLLEEFGLWNRRDDEVRTFSSGMKQRLKYVAALAHDPWFLLLDEPTSNLDSEGSAVVKAVAQRYAKRGILVVATNDEEEAAWCTRSLRMETADRPHEGWR